MKFLFHITGYKNPDQFAWLYRAIYNENDLFVIHVDQKSPGEVHSGFQALANGHENTHFIASLPIVWGGIGLIQAELAAIRYALDIDPNWHYLINLSAQDYPLIPLNEIRTRLDAAWPHNFVECKALSTVHWRIRKRIWFRYIEHRSKRHFTPIPRPLYAAQKIKWYGAWWHILSHDFCVWWSTATKAEGYLKALQSAGMPDEFLIQNIIQDSPFQDTVIPECRHEIIWCNPGDPLSTTAHPNILTMRNRDALTSSRAFFARKFDRSVDREILEFLAQRTGALQPKERIHKIEQQGIKINS